MASKKTKKRSPSRTPRTAIVPRVVFQTVVAAAVVPVMGLATVGCGQAIGPAADAGTDGQVFSVVAAPDAGHDAAFSVVADGGFGVADVGFSVAVPIDGGEDSGFFSVVAMPDDGGFSVLVAPIDSGNAQS